tara:strand:+ start:420 stop:722 length:303 start_codon:yes stop_codon:yes gene_type:complete
LKKIVTILFISFLFGNDADLLSKATRAIEKKKYNEALFHINMAEASNKKNPDFFRLKGLIYEMLDEPDQAKKAWKKCYKYSRDTNMKREAKVHIYNLSHN